MLKPPHLGSPFRHLRGCVLTARILPAVLVTQAWAVDWNGAITLDVNPTVGVGLVEGRVDGSPFDTTSPNIGNGPNNGFGPGISLNVRMGQDTKNFAQGTTADFNNFWNDNRTWIYTGEINSGPIGLLSFAESIDDSIQIKIDGAIVLKDQVSNVPTATGVLQYTPNTYHTIEIRLGNSVGPAGPVSMNNFVAAVAPNGYGFGFSRTGAIGTDGANYIKPVDPGDGSLFRHEVAPAAAANQVVNVLGSTVVTLNKITSDHITENGINFVQAGNAVTLTVNGSTPGGTLRSLSTVLANHSGTSAAAPNIIGVNGDADFVPGALSTGPTSGTATLTNVVLQKNGGTGKLILDDPTNNLAGTTLKVVDGLLSVVGSGGASSPISSLTTPIEVVGNSGGTFAPVLRFGGGATPTTFNNRIRVTNNGTIEHVSPATDIIGGTTLSIEPNKTLTVNVSGGGLVVNGAVSSSLSISTTGGTVKKTGLGTLQLNGTTFVQAINAGEGRLEVKGQLRGLTLNPAIAIGANATLALLNTDPLNFNRLPTTVTVTSGTLEGVPGAFRSGAAGTPTILDLAGGALTLAPGAGGGSAGLIANLYEGDIAGANLAFNTYANYLTYFTGRGAGTVANTGANGFPDLAFGLPIGSDSAMFAPIAPSFTATNDIVSRMHGKILITTPGTYTFGAGSDFGSMVYIDQATVVANNFFQGYTRRSGTVHLSAGLHDIDIGYYAGGGLNSLVVDLAGPGISGTQAIPNSVLVPFPSEVIVYNNPVTVTANATINSGGARLPSLSMSAGKTLTVNGYLLNTGATTLNGAGTYTIDTTTQYGEVVVPSIVDGGAQITLVKNGAGTLVLEAGAGPQLQGAGSSVTANAGGIGLVLGPVSPLGNATLDVNGGELIFSSKGGNQTLALPTFTNGGPISARKLGSGVVGTVGNPIRVTLTGNLTLNPGKTLDLSTRDNYILALGGISGNAAVNLRDGTVETSGVVNLGGPLSVAFSTFTAAQSVTASLVNIADGTITAPSIASSGALNITNGNVTANGSLSATNIVIDKSTVTSSGIIATGAGGIQINGGVDNPVASHLNLNGSMLSGGPITARGGVIHAVSGLNAVATTATFTDASNSGLLGRFVSNGLPGMIWPPNTEAGIFEIEHRAGVEQPLTGALSFGPYQAADNAISAFFGNVPTEPNQFAIGFFGNFTAPVSGLYFMQTAQVDDDAGFWVDLDGNGLFQTAGAAGNELIARMSCCGDSAFVPVALVAGRTYRVAIGLEDGQGGSSLTARLALPGGFLADVDPSNPAQAGYWSYGVPNQVVVDAGAELHIQALNGAVDVSANGRLELNGAGPSAVDSLAVGVGGAVVASHSVSAGKITVNGGTFTGSSSVTVAADLSLTNSTFSAHGAINAGSITAIGSTLTSFGAITTGPGGITINGTSSLQLNGSTISGGPISVNGGTMNVATATVNANVVNSGTVRADSGTLALNGSYSQTAGSTVLDGGNISTTTILNLTGGALRGSGTVTGNVFNNGVLAPGFSAGEINIAGDLSLGSDAQFVVEIGGIDQGTGYDFVSEAGSVPLTLGGLISVTMLGGFQPDPFQSFTVLSSNQPLLGQFSNAASGAEIVATDGTTSFHIFYGADSPFSSNTVVLTGDGAVPEPGSLGLLTVGALGILGRRPRRGAIRKEKIPAS